MVKPQKRSLAGVFFRKVEKRRLLLALPLSLSLFLAWTGCSSSDSKPTSVRAAGNQSVPVSVTSAVREDLPVHLVGLGSVTPMNAVSLKSRVDGQLVAVNFKEGQEVRKGQLLAQIDPRPFEVMLSQGQAAKFRDEALLRDAKLNYERFRSLLQESGAVSQQQVDTQQALVDQYEGTVRNDQAQIDNARLQLTYCHIESPISGRIGLRLVDPGNIVHASDQNPMLVVTELQPITVIFTLPEDQLPTVAQHMRNGQLTVEAYSRDDSTKLATGKLLTIDNEIDQTTGTGRLKAVFDNRDNQLWPNQFVNIRLLLETRKDSIVVPAAAIQRGPQGNFTYVVKQDQTVEVRPVVVALTQGNLSAVGQGLNPGEIVVTDGQDKLQAGMKVEAHAVGPAGSSSANNWSSANSANPASTGVNSRSRNSQANPGNPNARRNRQLSNPTP